MCLRFLIDTNVYDALAEVPDSVELANRLIERGEIVIFTTHVQEDELNRITDPG
ncbi:MAG: hypothetical protein ABSH03_05085 [Candidatus Lustribacter sp.]|jgi:hypothetical protein